MLYTLPEKANGYKKNNEKMQTCHKPTIKKINKDCQKMQTCHKKSMNIARKCKHTTNIAR